jgi:hypothetical protein
MVEVMSRTKRIPIARQAAMTISPRALVLFAQMKAARARRRAATCIVGQNPSGYCTASCAACQRWADLDAALHVELGLKPWVWPCLPRNPFPPGTKAAWHWHPADDSAQEALWRQLEATSRSRASGAA